MLTFKLHLNSLHQLLGAEQTPNCRGAEVAHVSTAMAATSLSCGPKGPRPRRLDRVVELVRHAYGVLDVDVEETAAEQTDGFLGILLTRAGRVYSMDPLTH